MQGVKLVTFDATNTLLKFRVPPWQHYTVVAREFGFHGTSKEVKHRLLDSYKVMWKRYPNFGKSEIQWEQWWKNVVELTFEGHLPAQINIEHIATRLIEEYRTSKCWCLAEGAEKLLQLLHDDGNKAIGIISNFDPRLRSILQNCNIYNYFDFVITSYDIGYSKPDRRIFDYAVEKCKEVSPPECLHIGDDLKKDYEGARNAGWHALLVSNILNAEKPPATDHVFNSLVELCNAIENQKLNL